ncbi:MAG: hypothetical protein JXR48_00610 [Candidatus Delongbacteria bacterium]|nr:hypothetical protein [Candidatus Delongbacteria bacterium]
MSKEIYDITCDIELSSYYELRNIAEYFYEKSKKYDENDKQSNGYFFYAASITFTTFMFEAYMNYSGYYVGFNWDKDNERLSTLKKFDAICGKLGIEFDKGKEPYQTISNLCSENFRNSIVHGKSFRKDNEKIDNVTDVHGATSKLLKKSYLSKEVKWKSYINKNYALKAYEDTMEIILMIYNLLKSKVNEFPRAYKIGHPLVHTPYSAYARYIGTGDDDL